MADDAADYKTCESSSNGGVSVAAIVDGKCLPDAGGAGYKKAAEKELDGIGVTVNYGLIGSGSFTDVFRCEIKGFGQVAVKEIKLNVSLRSAELTALQNSNHPNLVRLHKWVQGKSTKLVLDLCFGNFKDILHGSLGSNQKCIKIIEQRLRGVYDILSGATYLHSHDILHRDVCSKNCFVGQPLEENSLELGPLKLGEAFMTAKQFTGSEAMTVWTGSSAYMAPEEMDEEDAYGKPSDVYACAILLHEAACRVLPYDGKDTEQPMFALMIYQGMRPRLESVPAFSTEESRKDLLLLLEESWTKVQTERPTALEFRRRLGNILSACGLEMPAQEDS